MNGPCLQAGQYGLPGFLVLLLGLLTLLWIPVPSHTFLWKAVNNFCHVPLFAGVAIVLVHLIRQLGEPRGWSAASHYAVALAGVVVLGAGSEGIQSFTPGRYPDVSDVLLDIVGGLCALGVGATADPRLSERWRRWQVAPRKHVVRIVSGGLVLAALSPVIIWAYATWHRDHQFPILCQFSSVWDMRFVQAIGSDLSIVSPPSGWTRSSGETVGRIVFHPTNYPGIRINEPSPDWRGYERFSLEIYSEWPTPQPLHIRIDDAHHNQEQTDRFTRRVIIAPGLNQIQIPLEDIRQAPVGREMDLSSIASVIIFAVTPAEAVVLYLDHIRLE